LIALEQNRAKWVSGSREDFATKELEGRALIALEQNRAKWVSGSREDFATKELEGRALIALFAAPSCVAEGRFEGERPCGFSSSAP
jgi:hypothetical protein